MLFVPRQVALAASSSQPRTAAAGASAMAKEEPKKEKKSKRKAAAAANGAAAAPGARAAVVASVAAFLEAAGLPRTLAALQSEAGLEAGAWGSSQVNLEELVARFLEPSNSTPAAAVLGSNEQDKENGDIAGEAGKKKKKNGGEAGEPESKASEPSAHEKPSGNIGDEAKEKKQKKKKDKGDPSAAKAASGEATETVKNDDQKLDVDGEAKEKKQKKDKGDPSAVDAVSGEATETDRKLDVDGEAKEKKQKKKKDKDKGDPSAANAASGEATETVKNNDQKVDGKKKKSKKQGKDDDVEARLEKAELSIINKLEAAQKVNGDGNESREEEPKSQNDGADESSGAVEKKKKKKEKSAVETLEKTDAGSAPAEADGAKGKDDDVEARLEKAELSIINKLEAAQKVNGDGNESREEEPKSQNDGADESSGAVEKKKKKKEKSAVETLEKTDAGSAPAEADGAKGKNGVVETVKDDDEKKAKKKRKKSNPEENVEVEGKEAAGEDPVPKQDDVNKSGMDVDEDHQGKSSNENAVAGKKRKLEEVEGSIAPMTPKEDSTANRSLSNGFAEDKTNEDSNIKPSKRQKKSSEPKSVTPFQRIKVDSVTFADERLQDNSYWAKGGADTGYGAKAQEILGQVKGRGFRHEKTKKKHGTYRGGQIDLQTHSIKFENSDDE